jgi:hypothetical protein
MSMTFSNTPMRRVLALTTVAALVGCSGGGKDSASTTEGPATTEPTTSTAVVTVAPTTTTTTIATTTTSAPKPVMPLTGLPVTNPRIVTRPALVVKMDNHKDARPHAGINQADVVYEEIVEANITRFFVIFHSMGAAPFGPIRSARTTDVNLLNQRNRPLFVWSGGNANVVRAIGGANAESRAYGQAPGFYRDQARHRRAAIEHTLMNTSTENIWATARKNEGPPPPLFQYRAGSVPSKAVTPASAIDAQMRSVPVHWQWVPALKVWVRSEYGAPHLDAAGLPVTTNNVVFQFVPYHQSPADARSPEAETVGQGNAIVFTDGKVILGHWSRPKVGKPAVFTDAKGQPILLTPGRTWVELAEAGVTQVHFR